MSIVTFVHLYVHLYICCNVLVSNVIIMLLLLTQLYWMHIYKYISKLVCYITSTYILWGYTRLWTMLINSLDLIGKLIMYILDIYILHTFKILWTYYHYIHLLLMKSPIPCFLWTANGECLNTAYCILFGSHFYTQQHIAYNYYSSAYEQWSYKVLPHGHKTVSRFGTDLFLSQRCFGCQILDWCHIFVSKHFNPYGITCLLLF